MSERGQVFGSATPSRRAERESNRGVGGRARLSIGRQGVAVRAAFGRGYDSIVVEGEK